MNEKARIATVEVLLNPEEVSRLDMLRGGLGRSPYFRSLMHAAARTHGMPPAAPKESRHCRGVGRVASRASTSMSQRRQV